MLRFAMMVQEGFLLWSGNSTVGFETIPNAKNKTFTALPGSLDQSYVELGSVDTCIRPNQMRVQQCRGQYGFGSFSLLQSRTGKEGSFLYVGGKIARPLLHDEPTILNIPSLGEFLKPEVLSACIFSSNSYSSSLAAPGDVLRIELQASREVQVGPFASPFCRCDALHDLNSDRKIMSQLGPALTPPVHYPCRRPLLSWLDALWRTSTGQEKPGQGYVSVLLLLIP